MANNVLTSIKKIFRGSNSHEAIAEELNRVSVITMEHRYDAGDFVGAAVILRNLLEVFGERKKKNHRRKGREFIHFILSNKHKDLKNLGYTHWQHINKIIHMKQSASYPYHQENLRKAMDFFKKEIKGINAIDVLM